MNMFQRGAAWLAEQQATHASVKITYRQEEVVVPDVPAVPGLGLPAEDQAEEVRLQSTTRDWLIRVADLRPGGPAIEPQPGDTITEVAGGITRVWSVTDWRWSDTSNIRRRITTVAESET